MRRAFVLTSVLILSAIMSASAAAPRKSLKADIPSAQLQKEFGISMNHLMRNLQHPGIARGAVIASPSRQDPDYYFHWVRDAGLVMGTLLDYVALNRNITPALKNWIEFERHLQAQSMKGPGLGEPKFHVNGDIFTGPWGRPQNDGPAIRAWTMVRTMGQVDAGVQADLEYVKREWRNIDIDLWEEVRGHHFFTRFAQMAAFRQASMATVRQQPNLSREYAMIAQQIEGTLGQFIDPRTKLVTPSLPGSQGHQKHAGLDISVILAIIYFGPTPNWSVTNPYILHTMHRMEEVFGQVYNVNRQYPDMAPGLGRYPEDVYDGNGFSGGNPWYLATFGAAELYCSLIDELGKAGQIRIDPLNAPFYEQALGAPVSSFSRITRDQDEYWHILRGLQSRALSFIQRAWFHVGPDRQFAEQFDRNNGFRRGARDLTWSYAASLRAYHRCHGTLNILESVRR